MFVAAQPGAQFIQLEMREPEVAQGALVESLSVRACAGQPGDDGRLPVAKDPFGGGRIQPFSERCQHHCDLLGGGFQTVQGSVAPSSESRVTGLAAKCLDLFSATMGAIPN